MLKEAWEEIAIIINANINELCNQGRYSDAKELENSRDVVAVALAMFGMEGIVQ